MAYTATYAGLKADILQMTEDYSEDLITNLDNIIQSAETMVLRDLELERFQDLVSAGNTTASDPEVTWPTTLVTIESLWITVSSSRIFVPKRTLGFCYTYWPNSSTTDTPAENTVFWAEKNETTLIIAPTPDDAYALNGYGVVRPTGLSETNTTSWLGSNVGDLLLNACLIKAEAYLTNTAGVAVWKAQYDDGLLKAALEFRGHKRADDQLGRPNAPIGGPL